MEATWLRYIFKELNWTSKDVKIVKIYGDNQSALALTENPELYQPTKHINIAVKYHYLREERSRGSVSRLGLLALNPPNRNVYNTESIRIN